MTTENPQAFSREAFIFFVYLFIYLFIYFGGGGIMTYCQ